MSEPTDPTSVPPQEHGSDKIVNFNPIADTASDASHRAENDALVEEMTIAYESTLVGDDAKVESERQLGLH